MFGSVGIFFDMFSEELIVRAESGDVDALVQLDGQGLLVGAAESLPEYVERLRRLQANTAQMDETLATDGKTVIEGIPVDASERIPPALYDTVREATESLYSFAVDWVPGFYINPSHSWLFGGCAFYFYPDFFALFIIRKAFADRERWLIYSRSELLAHELCHVARIGLLSDVYEESFAYQTATSPFRKAVGSVFRSPMDSYLLLAGTFLLLIAQIFRVSLFPALWIWPFWGIVFGTIGYLAVRHVLQEWTLSRAFERLTSVFGEQARAILFRCTDREVDAIARLHSPEALRDWIDSQPQDSVRWQVIKARFMSVTAAAAQPADNSEGDD